MESNIVTIVYIIYNHADIIIIHVHIEYIAVIPFIFGGFVRTGGGELKVVMTLYSVTKKIIIKNNI